MAAPSSTGERLLAGATLLGAPPILYHSSACGCAIDVAIVAVLSLACVVAAGVLLRSFARFRARQRGGQ